MKKLLAVLLTILVAVPLFAFSPVLFAKDGDKGGGNGGKEEKCNFTARFEKEPATIAMEAGQEETFTLLVTNNCGMEQLKIKASSENTGLELGNAEFEVAPKGTFRLTVKIKQPPKSGTSNEVHWMIKLVSQYGKQLEFKFITRYKITQECRYSVKWEKDPTSGKLDPGQEGEYNLVVTNLGTSKITFKVTSKTEGLRFSVNEFSAEAGQKFILKVIIKQTAKGQENFSKWAFVIATDCGGQKEIVFRVFFKVTEQPSCKFTFRWQKSPESVKLDPGQEAEFPLEITNKGTQKTTIKIEYSGEFLKFSAKEFELEPGAKFVLKVTVKQPPIGKEPATKFSFVLVASCGQKAQISFRIFYKTPPASNCEFEVRWEKNPANTPLKAGQRESFNLLIKNKTGKNMKFAASSGSSAIKFSPDRLEVPNGHEKKMKVTITMPGKQNDEKERTFEITIKADCGTTKVVKFTVKYK